MPTIDVKGKKHLLPVTPLPEPIQGQLMDYFDFKTGIPDGSDDDPKLGRNPLGQIWTVPRENGKLASTALQASNTLSQYFGFLLKAGVPVEEFDMFMLLDPGAIDAYGKKATPCTYYKFLKDIRSMCAPAKKSMGNGNGYFWKFFGDEVQDRTVFMKCPLFSDWNGPHENASSYLQKKMAREASRTGSPLVNYFFSTALWMQHAHKYINDKIRAIYDQARADRSSMSGDNGQSNMATSSQEGEVMPDRQEIETKKSIQGIEPILQLEDPGVVFDEITDLIRAERKVYCGKTYRRVEIEYYLTLVILMRNFPFRLDTLRRLRVDEHFYKRDGVWYLHVPAYDQSGQKMFKTSKYYKRSRAGGPMKKTGFEHLSLQSYAELSDQLDVWLSTWRNLSQGAQVGAPYVFPLLQVQRNHRRDPTLPISSDTLGNLMAVICDTFCWKVGQNYNCTFDKRGHWPRHVVATAIVKKYRGSDEGYERAAARLGDTVRVVRKYYARFDPGEHKGKTMEEGPEV